MFCAVCRHPRVGGMMLTARIANGTQPTSQTMVGEWSGRFMSAERGERCHAISFPYFYLFVFVFCYHDLRGAKISTNRGFSISSICMIYGGTRIKRRRSNGESSGEGDADSRTFLLHPSAHPFLVGCSSMSVGEFRYTKKYS
jgi:hypothetical protein